MCKGIQATELVCCAIDKNVLPCQTIKLPCFMRASEKLTPADVCSDVRVEQLRSTQPGEGQAVCTSLGPQEQGWGGKGRGRRGEGGGERRGTESLVRRQGERGRQSRGG